jgi:hypothetical protein
MFDSESASSISAKDFVLRELRADPDLSYAELRKRASEAGLSVPPFLYGQTRRELGLPLNAESARHTASEVSRPHVDLAAADDEIAGDLDDSTVSMAVAGVRSTGGSRNWEAEEETAAEPAPAVRKEEAAPAQAKGSGFQFAVDTLRLSPDITFQDLKLRAQMAGLPMQPIVFGRAKALLGLVPTKPRVRKAAPVEAPRTLRQVDSAQLLADLPKAGPLSGAISASISKIEELVRTVRELEAENRHLRNALQAAFSIASAAIDDSTENG